MAYMKSNVNFGLFLLITATLIIFSGVSIYYQSTYHDLYSDYHAKIQDLENISTTLNYERSRLNQTSYQLQVKEQREQELSTIYTGVISDKERIEEQNARLHTELKSKTDELIQKKLELAQAVSDLEKSKQDLSEARISINQKDNLISALRRDITSLNEDIDNLQAQLAACQSPSP